MTARAGLLALAGCLVALPAHGQALARVSPTAFPLSITAYLGLAWGGKRAEGAGTTWKVGSTPQIGVEVQIPLPGTFGLGLAGMAGRPNQVLCQLQCSAPDRLTQVHGSAMVLWRFKARAPIYFGLGGAVSYVNPAPVPSQSAPAIEPGGAAVIAYDFAFGPNVGGRIAWWNYLVKPKSENLGVLGARDLAWDTQIAFGLRFRPGS